MTWHLHPGSHHCRQEWPRQPEGAEGYLSDEGLNPFVSLHLTPGARHYDGDDVRSSLLMHGILPVIPPKPNRNGLINCDFKAYKDPNRIERVNRRSNLTPYRRPILTPLSGGF
jgi:hypothetical protein